MLYLRTYVGRVFMACCTLILLAGTATAQLNLSDKIPVDPAVKIGKLKNGLTYYIRKNTLPEKKVELRLIVNAGSICEDDDQQGLAHMCEHMAFNGTTHFKKNDIVSFLQNIGVGFGNDLNAYTSFDETVYMLPIPTDKPGNLEKGFQVLEDWAHNVTYLAKDIDDERDVILEESRMGKGANERLQRKIFPHIFAGSKYAVRLPIGKDSIIKHCSYDALRRFYRDWYRPNLMAVIVVGDIDPVKVEALIKKHFTALTNPVKERPRVYATIDPYKKDDALVATDKEATSYNVGISYPVMKVSPSVTIGQYREDILKNMFSAMLNQRLQEQAQKDNPPFIFGSADFSSYAHGYEAFSGFAGVGTGDISKGLKGMVEEIERVKRYGFTAAELERAKKNTLASYENAYNNRTKTESGNYVEEYMNNFLQQEAIPGIEKEYSYAQSIVPAITLDDVNKVANLFKNEKNTFTYVMGPDPKAGEKIITDSEIINLITATEGGQIQPYSEKVLASSLLSKEPAAGKVTSKTANAAMGTTDYTLSNGVTVTLKSTNFKTDQILMAAARPGGKSNYGVGDKFNADYMTSVIGTMGVGNFSPTDLGKVLAGKSVGVSPAWDDVSEGMSGNSSIKDLETMFQLTYLYFTQPRKDVDLFNSFIQKSKSQVAMLAANPQTAFVDTLFKTMYNNNPLARKPVPETSDFDKINPDRVLQIYNERFGNAYGMHFTFVGSFTEAQVLPLIEKYIASLPATQKQFNFVDNGVRPITGNHTLEVDKGADPKSLILSFCYGEMPYSDDMGLKAQAISEVMNIRIIEELREKIQGIYSGGMYAQFDKQPYANYAFTMQLPCNPEKADTLMKAAKKELNNIITNGPSQVNLDKVKKQWIESYRSAIKENGTWLESIRRQHLLGTSPDRLLNYEANVNKLTTKDVQDAAKLFFGNNASYFNAILMPEKK